MQSKPFTHCIVLTEGIRSHSFPSTLCVQIRCYLQESRGVEECAVEGADKGDGTSVDGLCNGVVDGGTSLSGQSGSHTLN